MGYLLTVISHANGICPRQTSFLNLIETLLIKLFLNKLEQDFTVKLSTFARVQDKAFQIGIASLARAP